MRVLCVLTQDLFDGPYVPPLDTKSVIKVVTELEALSAAVVDVMCKVDIVAGAMIIIIIITVALLASR